MLNMQYDHKNYVITSFENIDNYEDVIIKRSVALAVQLNQLINGYKQIEIFTYQEVLEYINDFMEYVQEEYKFKPSIVKIKKEFNKAREINFVNYDVKKIDAYYPIMKDDNVTYNTKMVKLGYVRTIINNDDCLKNSNRYSIENVITSLNRHELSLEAYQRYLYKNQHNTFYDFNYNLTRNKYIKRYELNYE